MAFPSDIYLALSAKYFGFVDGDTAYNTNWDITWSFTYALTGQQHGFCTFLAQSSIDNPSPGQYLSYFGLSPYLLDEFGDYVLDEFGERIALEGIYDYSLNGYLAIAFDSTGYFALSNNYNTNGVSIDNVIPNSLVIWHEDNLILNESLTALDSTFTLAPSSKEYKTLRFRLANAGKKLHIDYKYPLGEYKSLTSVTISSFNVDSYPYAYPAFSYSSPISSLDITPSTLWLKNFHVQGTQDDPTTESLSFVPLSSSISSGFTTISGITANLV